MGSAAHAETVEVKYRGSVDLTPFACDTVTRSSFVQRVCYDEKNAYMLINLSLHRPHNRNYYVFSARSESRQIQTFRQAVPLISIFEAEPCSFLFNGPCTSAFWSA
jgi:hypothetical protein